jgi:hypothetical protein
MLSSGVTTHLQPTAAETNQAHMPMGTASRTPPGEGHHAVCRETRSRRPMATGGCPPLPGDAGAGGVLPNATSTDGRPLPPLVQRPDKLSGGPPPRSSGDEYVLVRSPAIGVSSGDYASAPVAAQSGRP